MTTPLDQDLPRRVKALSPTDVSRERYPTQRIVERIIFECNNAATLPDSVRADVAEIYLLVEEVNDRAAQADLTDIRISTVLSPYTLDRRGRESREYHGTRHVDGDFNPYDA
jgi:hypothetical protein